MHRLVGGMVVLAAALALGAFASDGSETAGPLAAPSAAATGIESGAGAGIKSGSGYLCRGRYALCSKAKCVQSKTNPNVTICGCDIYNGYSFGYTPCSARAAIGNRLISTFSDANVESDSRGMVCPAGSKWANCLDRKCRVDPRNPRRAICSCTLVRSGAYGTLGGNCDQGNCRTVIYSAAAASSPVARQFAQAMKRIGRTVKSPKACPTCKT